MIDRTVLSALDDLIASRSLLKHPFYLMWLKGELHLSDLRVYAKEYFHLVERVPGIVSSVRSRVPDPRLRSRIDGNIAEETEHVDLWKRFARSLGVTEEALTNHKPSAGVRDAVRALEKLAEGPAEDGAAAMYALESELSKIAETKKEGLLRFYGLSSADAHAYFDEHLAEEKHLDVWRSMQVEQDRATMIVSASLDAQHTLLDSVCDACGITMIC